MATGTWLARIHLDTLIDMIAVTNLSFPEAYCFEYPPTDVVFFRCSRLSMCIIYMTISSFSFKVVQRLCLQEGR